MIEGLGLVVAAAVLQGIFLLPMARARTWAWEHIWLAFSLSGMILGNWILASLALPNPLAIYASVPRQELLVLVCFGVTWGIGAVLFGLGMEMIGLTLGYPLIMGLNASVGTLVPMLRLYSTSMFVGRRLLIVAGTAVAIAGVALCSVAGARRGLPANHGHDGTRLRFVTGLIVAIASGALSCLPNIGLTFGVNTLRTARDLGASSGAAANAVWLIFFTCGGIVNILYCLGMVARHKNLSIFFARDRLANWLWALAMGIMWIGSFYLYGIGVARLGAGGSTMGWPILIALSIGVGVLGGLARGEWKGAPSVAKNLLWQGLALLLLAVFIIPFGTGPR